MPHKFRAYAGLAGLFVCALLFSGGCSRGDQAANQGGAEIPVTVVRVTPKTVPLVIETVGRAEGSKEVEIRARVTGILEKQVYSEGEAVKAGQVLFQIEAAPYEIALQHARAALAQERARNQQARRDAERLTALAEQNAVSRRSADDALSELESSEAALLAAEARVREAELNLSYTKVVAPIGGITGRALRSEGTLVTAGTDSSLLTTLTQTDPMWVRFALSESEYAALRAAEDLRRNSMSVSLLGKNGEARAENGKLNFAASTVDESLGTVQMRAEFANPKLAILPGEYLRVRLSGGSRQAILVPQKAVQQSTQGPFVWLATEEGKAQQRRVKTGAWSGSDWEILEGLQEGDVVIIDNLLKLRADARVKPSEATEQSASAESGAVASAVNER
jgi:membrane fusion protein (multidrug efflux system)